MSDERAKRPAYQWYVNDARGDELFMLMTYEQQGIYRALLDHQWVEGSIPADPHRIAILLPKISEKRFLKLWPLISGKFQPHNSDRLLNARLESQRQKLDKFVQGQHEKGLKSAQKRKEMATVVAQRLQPEGNSSSSSSSSTKNKSISPAEKAPDECKQCEKEFTKAKAEKAPSPVREFLVWFQGEYKARRNGAVYFVKWEAHGAIVKRLLTGYPLDRLRKHAMILLRSNEPWIETTDRGVEVLSSKINWLEERLCAWEAEKRGREAV